MTDRGVGLRACPGRGERGTGQTRGMDAADHDPARRTRGRGGTARGSVPGAAGQGFGGRRAVRHPPRRTQDRVHRLHRGRHARDGGRSGSGQARHARTRRQERQHRVRRLRPGEGRSHRAVRRVRQRRSGLLCPQPNPGAAQCLRPFHGAARTRCQGCRGRRSGIRGHRDGPAGVEVALGHRRVLCARRRAGRIPRRCAVGAGLLVPADGADAGAHRPHCDARRSSGRWWRCFRSTTRPTPSRWPTTPRTACPGSIWTDNLSRALRVSRAVEAGNLSVNSHSSVRYNTPFGGFKQSGLGRELGPDAPLSFTETKNVFFAIGEA